MGLRPDLEEPTPQMPAEAEQGTVKMPAEPDQGTAKADAAVSATAPAQPVVDKGAVALAPPQAPSSGTQGKLSGSPMERVKQLDKKETTKTFFNCIGRSLGVFLILKVPFWAVPQAAIPSGFTPEAFLDRCEVGDHSWEAFHTASFLFFVNWLIFTVLLNTSMWSVTSDGTMAMESALAEPTWGSRLYRRLGLIANGLAISHGILRMVWSFMADQGFAPIYWGSMGLLMMTFLFAAVGWVQAAGEVGAAWAQKASSRGVATFLIFAFLIVCQFGLQRANAVLKYNGAIGVCALTLLVNVFNWLLKQSTMRGNVDPGMCAFLTMTLGACINFPVRLFIFMRPTVVDALGYAIMTVGINWGGHAINTVFFTTKGIEGLHPNLAVAHAFITWSNLVFEISTQIMAAVVLLVTSPYHYNFAGVGVKGVNHGLVLTCAVVSIALEFMSSAAIIATVQASLPLDMKVVARSPRFHWAIMSFGVLITATTCLTVNIRDRCLRCDIGWGADWCFD